MRNYLLVIGTVSEHAFRAAAAEMIGVSDRPQAVHAEDSNELSEAIIKNGPLAVRKRSSNSSVQITTGQIYGLICDEAAYRNEFGVVATLALNGHFDDFGRMMVTLGGYIQKI